MLQTIAGMIRSELGDYDLIRELAQDTNIVRIRIADESFDNAEQIGTPPVEFARQSNRMSPAGIPMFYGAFDEETAFAETFEPEHNAGQVASSGTFQPVRNIRVLDLAELPQIPSVFDPDRRGLIHTLRFLHAFADDISKRIERDGREHIEYVPTQIVTEYFRRVFRTEEGEALDGIVYRSARCPGARAVVLFCEHRQCIDADSTAYDESLMRLIGVAHWNCPAGGTNANPE